MMLIASADYSGGPLDIDRKLRQECYRRAELRDRAVRGGRRPRRLRGHPVVLAARAFRDARSLCRPGNPGRVPRTGLRRRSTGRSRTVEERSCRARPVGGGLPPSHRESAPSSRGPVIPILDARRMRAAERAAIRGGVASARLMENAAEALVEELLRAGPAPGAVVAVVRGAELGARRAREATRPASLRLQLPTRPKPASRPQLHSTRCFTSRRTASWTRRARCIHTWSSLPRTIRRMTTGVSRRGRSCE